MRIAILGATSQIAKDLILSFATQSQHDLVLYARRPGNVKQWLIRANLAQRYAVADFAAFASVEHFDAILNFVGVGNPAQAAAMGASIFDVTLQYDELALAYVRNHPACRYIFLSSGAAYGARFDDPVDANTMTTVPINNLQPQDWYGVAKLHAECRHRTLAPLPIVDIRVFNYFSGTQNLDAKFFLSEVLKCIRDKTVFRTGPSNMTRDYLGPTDFHQLVSKVLASSAQNMAIDCYSAAPVDKQSLLNFLVDEFKLEYEIIEAHQVINATGLKSQYYSQNHIAESFGYDPQVTSLQNIKAEFGTLLTRPVLLCPTSMSFASVEKDKGRIDPSF